MKIGSRWQPAVVAALAILALTGFAAYDLARERAATVAEAKANTANLARLLQAHAEQTLRRVDARLALAADRLLLEPASAAPGSAALADDLRKLLPRDGLVSALIWLDADGQVLSSSLAPQALAAVSSLLQDWQARRLAKPAARIIVGRQQAFQPGQWQLPIGRALPGPAAGGSLVALMETASLQTLFDSVDTGRSGFISVFLDDGWLLANAPRDDALFARNWLDAALFKQHLPAARSGSVQQVMARDGAERVYSYRTLTDYPLVVSIGISMTDALTEWRQRIVWDAVLLGGVGSALLLAAAGMARSIGRREAAERRAADTARQAQASISAARDAAQQSAHFLHTITDNLPLCIAYVDQALRFSFVNRAQCERLGLPREAIIGKTRQELSDVDLPAHVSRAVSLVQLGQAQQVIFEEFRQGRRQVMEAFMAPDTDAAGTVKGVYLAATDVTERQAQQARIEQALAERETLLREVYHRVKNNLQVIQSLLNLQRRALPEGQARSALSDSIQRVQAMALVHEKLYQAGNLAAIDLPDYTADLLRRLGESTDASQRGITLSPRIDPIIAALQEAVPFGLLVTELVTNSLKHAFPAGGRGNIEVALRQTAQGSLLVVQDNGVGLPDGFCLGALGNSMGLQLATSLAQQLGGELQASSQHGACFTASLKRLGSADDAQPLHPPPAPAAARSQGPP